MKGKDKCKALKQIRQRIADENDIEYVTRECTFKGECKGTCPKCEAELKYLEEQIEKRQKLGKKVVLAGLSAGMTASLCACNVPDAVENVGYVIGDAVESVKNVFSPNTYELEGEATIEGNMIEPPIDGGLVEVQPEEIMGEFTDGSEIDPDSGESCPDLMGDFAFEGESVFDFELFFNGTEGAKYKDKILYYDDFNWDFNDDSYIKSRLTDFDNDGELEQLVDGPNGGFYLDYGPDDDGEICLRIVMIEEPTEEPTEETTVESTEETTVESTEEI